MPASTTEDSEADLSVFCAMHVIDTHTKVTPFGDKSFKKFQECAAKWINVKESSESRVAAKFLQQQQESEGVGPFRCRGGGDDTDTDGDDHEHKQRTGR